MTRLSFANAILIVAVSLAAATTASLCGTKPAAAQSKAQNWSVSCVSRSRVAGAECSVEQRVLIRETGQTLGRLLIKTGANDGGPGALLLQIPLGVSIQAGIKLRVDDAEIEALEIQTCDAGGCYAGGPLSEKLLGAAKAGKLLNVEFSDTQQRAVSVNFVLDGFSAAYGDIR
jgi:invasion protein IalB